MVVQMLLFFFPRVTHSLVERLCYSVTKIVTLWTKKRNSLWRSKNVGFYNLIPKETCITKWKKLPAKKKKLFKAKKYNVTVKDKRPCFYFILLILNRFSSAE